MFPDVHSRRDSEIHRQSAVFSPSRCYGLQLPFDQLVAMIIVGKFEKVVGGETGF